MNSSAFEYAVLTNFVGDLLLMYFPVIAALSQLINLLFILHGGAGRWCWSADNHKGNLHVPSFKEA